MITRQLINPESIAVIGGREYSEADGRAILTNLEKTFSGRVHAVGVRPGAVRPGGRIQEFPTVRDIPSVDCALLCCPACECVETVDELVGRKSCRAVVIMSSGFREAGPGGAGMERRIKDICDRSGAALIGPNCTGLVTPAYAGTFRQSIPALEPTGAVMISASGSTIVYIIETASRLGLKFSSLYSVGNSAQNGVEDILEYIDRTYTPGESPKVVMLYIESVTRGDVLLRHASSLISKGVRICALKAGASDAGRQAASLHTGAVASPDRAVDALFRKCGIIRCWSRTEFVFAAAAMMLPELKGGRLAVISQSGGPAILQTDVFATSGIDVPRIDAPSASGLLRKLNPGASVSNPIDLLSNATAGQLGEVLDFCEKDCPQIDAMTVIWGSSLREELSRVCDVLLDRMKKGSKPVYVMLDSPDAASPEIESFHDRGAISFPDEVLLARTLVRLANLRHFPAYDVPMPPVDRARIREVIANNGDGFLQPEQVRILLDAAGISRVREASAYSIDEAFEAVRETGGYPVAMKAIGPLHLTDMNGTSPDIREDLIMKNEFERLMKIPSVSGVLFRRMLSGTEIFIGARREEGFGHLIMCGPGGVFMEVLEDITTALSPISKEEAGFMIESLRTVRLLKGCKSSPGVNLNMLNDTIRRVSALCMAAPEILELELNPLLGSPDSIVAVDARISLKK